MPRLSVRAILAGVLADFALSVALGILVLFVWGRILVSRGKTQTEIAREIPAKPTFLLIALVVGLTSLVAGGFLAGRIAGGNYLLHGALVGGIALFTSLLIGSGAHPAWFKTSSLLLEIPAATLGAMLAKGTRGEPGASPSGENIDLG